MDNNFSPSKAFLDIAMPYADESTKKALAYSYFSNSLESFPDHYETIFMSQRTLFSSKCSNSDLTFYIIKMFNFAIHYLKYFSVDKVISTIVPHSFTDYLLLRYVENSPYCLLRK